jgi:hypothetical protein
MMWDPVNIFTEKMTKKTKSWRTSSAKSSKPQAISDQPLVETVSVLSKVNFH